MTDIMRSIDGRLSRRAQVRLGTTALVYREPDGSYTLERRDQPPLGLGARAGDAEAALIALHHAAHYCTTPANCTDYNGARCRAEQCGWISPI